MKKVRRWWARRVDRLVAHKWVQHHYVGKAVPWCRVGPDDPEVRTDKWTSQLKLTGDFWAGNQCPKCLLLETQEKEERAVAAALKRLNRSLAKLKIALERRPDRVRQESP